MYHCIPHSIVDWQWLVAAFFVGVIAMFVTGCIILMIQPEKP